MGAAASKYLYLVRHAESEGNVANVDARRNGNALIDVDANDRDVRLTSRGVKQAQALGAWFASRPPDCVWTSPYRRARDTAKLAAREWPASPRIAIDERLRERALGVLNRLTAAGIQERFPQEVVARARVGKFRYRPPEGESWDDVANRLGSVIDDVRVSQYQRIMIVSHQVIVLCLRFLLEGLSVEELMAIDSSTDVANCSVTAYGIAEDRVELESFNDTSALADLNAPVTKDNDAADIR